MIIIIIPNLGFKAFSYITSLNCVYWLGTVITSPTDIFMGSSNSQVCSSVPSTTTVPSVFPTTAPTTKSTLSPSFSHIPTNIPTIRPYSSGHYSTCTTTNAAVTVSGTSIAASAYEMCATVQSVTIASTIKTIGIFKYIIFINFSSYKK